MIPHFSCSSVINRQMFCLFAGLFWENCLRS